MGNNVPTIDTGGWPLSQAKRQPTQPAAPRRHWTAAIYTRINPLMRRALSSRWHRVVSGRAVMLGITGRRSGKQYEICVGYARHDAESIDVLVSDAMNRTWWRNFVDGGPVRVVLRGERYDGWATAYRAPTREFKEIADRAVPKIIGVRGARRFFAIPTFDPDVGLTDEDLRSLEGFAVAVHIALGEPRDPDRA